MLIVLYLRIRTRVAAARSLSTFLAAGFSLGTALWYASVFVPEPARFWLWGAGITIEILVPLIGNQVLASTPIHPTHLPERFGLFMIIVLGESVAGVVAGTADASWHLASGLVAAGGFVAAASLWWSYFDFAGWAAQCGLLTSARSGPLARDVYSYGHFPVAVSLALIGVGTELAILDTPHGRLAAATRWALFGGAALYLLGIAIIYSGMTKSVSAGLWPPRLAAVALTLALAGFGGGLAPLVAVAALALTLVAHVTLEIRRGRSGMGLPRVLLPQAMGAERESEPLSES